MIAVYYGKIGDGKTYHVLYQELIPALTQGRKVYTNIDGLLEKNYRQNLARLCNLLPNDLNQLLVAWRPAGQDAALIQGVLTWDKTDESGENLKIEHGALVIVDEAQMIYDATNYNKRPPGFLNLLEYHRHFGLDFVFVTQSVKRMESNISRLANHAYQAKNLGFLLGTKRRYVIHERQTPFDRDIVSTTSGSYRDEIFACYKSYRARNGFKRKSGGILTGAIGTSALVLILIAGGMFIKNGGLAFANLQPGKGVTVNDKSIGGGGAGTASAVSVSSVQVGRSAVVEAYTTPSGLTSDAAHKWGVAGPTSVEESGCSDGGYIESDGVRLTVANCGNVSRVRLRDRTISFSRDTGPALAAAPQTGPALDLPVSSAGPLYPRPGERGLTNSHSL